MDGNQVTWYACGPTVYDSTHIGHARYGRTNSKLPASTRGWQHKQKKEPTYNINNNRSGRLILG